LKLLTFLIITILIKINNENISTEINPIVLERFKENLKKAIEERGLKFNKDSNVLLDINLIQKIR
jgi:hypothetical protein